MRSIKAWRIFLLMLLSKLISFIQTIITFFPLWIQEAALQIQYQLLKWWNTANMKWFIQVRVKKGGAHSKKESICIYVFTNVRPNETKLLLQWFPRGTEGVRREESVYFLLYVFLCCLRIALLSALCVSVMIEVLFVCLLLFAMNMSITILKTKSMFTRKWHWV